MQHLQYDVGNQHIGIFRFPEYVHLSPHFFYCLYQSTVTASKGTIFIASYHELARCRHLNKIRYMYTVHVQYMCVHGYIACSQKINPVPKLTMNTCDRYLYWYSYKLRSLPIAMNSLLTWMCTHYIHVLPHVYSVCLHAKD